VDHQGGGRERSEERESGRVVKALSRKKVAARGTRGLGGSLGIGGWFRSHQIGEKMVEEKSPRKKLGEWGF